MACPIPGLPVLPGAHPTHRRSSLGGSEPGLRGSPPTRRLKQAQGQSQPLTPPGNEETERSVHWSHWPPSGHKGHMHHLAACLFATWCKAHGYGMAAGARVARSKERGSQVPFWCFAVLIEKNPTASACCGLPSLWGLGVGGSKEPSASGSLVAGGGHSGWGPSVGFAGLATRLLPCGFPSQVTGDHAAGALERW